MRIYLIALLLGLAVFPSVEKALHSFDHAHVEHCDQESKHFCEVEDQSCDICDFVFSASSIPLEIAVLSIPVSQTFGEIYFTVSPFKKTSEEPFFSLRGPPAC